MVSCRLAATPGEYLFFDSAYTQTNGAIGLIVSALLGTLPASSTALIMSWYVIVLPLLRMIERFVYDVVFFFASSVAHMLLFHGLQRDGASETGTSVTIHTRGSAAESCIP